MHLFVMLMIKLIIILVKLRANVGIVNQGTCLTRNKVTDYIEQNCDDSKIDVNLDAWEHWYTSYNGGCDDLDSSKYHSVVD